MHRLSLKIVGASGQGLDSIGEVLGKALKRSGYCVFGYREFPSLIKGGHASNQLDISDEQVESSETHVDVVIALNHHGLEHNLSDVKPGGIFLHSTPRWKFTEEQQKLIDRSSISVVELPIETILVTLGGKAILGNILLSSFVWAVLGQEKEALKKMVGEKFAKKKDLLELNMRCIDEGFALHATHKELTVQLPPPQERWKKSLLLLGSKAIGLGVTAAGVRVFAGYPMTPSSPLLNYLAAVQNKTGMVIKQAEDEITAAQIVSGAMHAGTRALTTTSGGGFDLMSETLSLNAIIENPCVYILAQRPGPATGLPTWTGQADLLMAVGTSHGEFARCVMAASNAKDGFSLVAEAFNIAEEFQINVILLTDKQIAEGLYTEQPFSTKTVAIKRGKLITNPKELKDLKATDRYDPSAPDGVSKRWLPGSEAATYAAQGDEHSADGTVDESSKNAIEQIDKRMRKMEALRKALPEPSIQRIENRPSSAKAAGGRQLTIDNEDKETDILLIGWGSTKSVVIDALHELSIVNYQVSIAYLHFAYLWPLKTEKLLRLATKAKKIILIEGNHQGQLGKLIRQECGLEITDKILKYDGRPFFVDELKRLVEEKIAPKGN